MKNSQSTASLLDNRQPPFFQHAKHLLTRMYERGKGKSKKDNRLSHKSTKRHQQDKEYIFSSSTLRMYIRHVYRFFRWIQQQEIELHTFQEALQYLQAYLDDLIRNNRSAFYIKLAGCSVLKLYPGHYLSDYRTPECRRKEIRRSRLHDMRYFIKAQKNHPDLFLFGLSTGLRKDKELARARGTDLVEKDGRWFVHTKGKNGQYRDAPIIGPPETIAKVVKMMREAGERKLFGPEGVFGIIPEKYDQHVLRSIYAVRIYLENERPQEVLPREERYRCRNEYAGIVLDRKAMLEASEALGHHRSGVIAQSYLWPMVTMSEELQVYFGITSKRPQQRKKKN